MESLIEPLYVTRRANEPITLGKAPVAITWKGERLQGHGEAILLLKPRLQIVIKAFFAGPAAFRIALGRSHVVVGFGEHSAPIKAMVQNASISESAELVLLPLRQQFTVSPNRRSRLTSMTFHVLNFPSFLCQTGDLLHKLPGGGRRMGQVILADAQWKIEIQEQPHTSDLVKDLKEEGGYGLTHVGRLMRADGRTFTSQAAERAMLDLYRLLSFARGSWTAPILCVGFNADGQRIFEDWSVRLAMPWEGQSSWFDVHHGEALTALYPAFAGLMRNPKSGMAASSALYWYLRSNRAGQGAGVDSGIILSQAALERLATAQLANVPSAPVDANAATRLRFAMKLLKLPTAIPKVIAAVYGARRKKAWSDLPEAITRVRNELVHPKAKLKVELRRVIPDIWQLAQWSIELWFLRLCGYNGAYSNRLQSHWRGEVEQVPWAKSIGTKRTSKKIQ